MKKRREIKKEEIRKIPPVITPAPGIKETGEDAHSPIPEGFCPDKKRTHYSRCLILKEAIALQKEGWKVIDIKSNPKTWVLTKEA